MYIYKIYFSGFSHENNNASTEIITRCILLPQITSSFEPELLQPGINIYPNPTADWVQIADIDNRTFKQMSIYDADGHLVSSQKVVNTSLNLSLSALPAGTYVIALEGEGVRLNKRVVKQ